MGPPSWFLIGIVGDPRTKTWTRVFALAAPDKLTALIKHMECE